MQGIPHTSAFAAHIPVPHHAIPKRVHGTMTRLISSNSRSSWYDPDPQRSLQWTRTAALAYSLDLPQYSYINAAYSQSLGQSLDGARRKWTSKNYSRVYV